MIIFLISLLAPYIPFFFESRFSAGFWRSAKKCKKKCKKNAKVKVSPQDQSRSPDIQKK
jgi:hypothetical protein